MQSLTAPPALTCPLCLPPCPLQSYTDTGSIMSISWTADGTQLAGSGGNGSVCFGQVVDVTMEDGRVRVNLEDDHNIIVQDILSETTDKLDFRDKVIKISLGFDHLIVATSTQCHIYSTSNWNTPHIFDLKDTVTLILQCDRHFLLLDNSMGLQIYTYEGRQICNPKFQGTHQGALLPALGIGPIAS